MTWTMPEPAEIDGPMTGPEEPLVHGYLAWQRHTLLRICAGLTGAQLASRPIASSQLSLLGLLRHLAKVERFWFVEQFGGQQFPPMYAGAKDADFEDTDPADAEADLERYLTETARAAEFEARTDPDATIDRHGEQMSLRFVRLHLIHEYARHNGHADMLREAIDGATGR